jgi:hypothetical protein
MHTRALTIFAAVLALLSPLLAREALAQAFTYQGRLDTNALPATGTYDFRFRVYAAAAGGSPVGVETTVLALPVTDGLFTATVSPGTGVFTGADRWLEIDVRPAGNPTYTTLTPRQQVRPTPMSIRSLSERWVDLGSGNLRADPAISRLFLNRASPVTSADYFSVRTPTGASAFGGMYIDTESATGLPFYGYATNSSVRAYHFFDAPTGDWVLVNGGNARLRVSGVGAVAIATTPGAEALRVGGTTASTNFTYITPQTRTLNIAAEDFRAFNTSTPGSFGGAPPFIAQLDPSVAYGVMHAPLPLPQGAQITSVLVSMQGGAGGPVIIELRRRAISNAQESIMASGSSANMSGEYATLTLHGANTPFDHTTYVYRLYAICNDWTTNSWVRLVRITYTVPAPD